MNNDLKGVVFEVLLSTRGTEYRIMELCSVGGRWRFDGQWG